MATQPDLDLRRRSSRTLWFSVIAPPFIFLSALNANYMLVNAACSNGTRIVLLLVSLGATLLVAGGVLHARRTWAVAGKDRDASEDSATHRARFVGILGLLVSSFMALLLVAQLFPTALLPACIGL